MNPSDDQAIRLLNAITRAQSECVPGGHDASVFEDLLSELLAFSGSGVGQILKADAGAGGSSGLEFLCRRVPGETARNPVSDPVDACVSARLDALCQRVLSTGRIEVDEEFPLESFGNSPATGSGTRLVAAPVRFRERLLAIVAWAASQEREAREWVEAVNPLLVTLARILETRRADDELITMEHALRVSGERLDFALRGGDLALWDWHVPSGRVDFNERWCTILGYSPGEIRPDISSWEMLVHPDDWERISSVLQPHLNGETPFYECEHRLRHKDGGWRWVLDRGQVMERDASGAPIRAVGTHMDITSRKLLEKGREEILQRFERIAAHVPGFIYQYLLRPDGSSCFPYASKGIAEIYGVQPEAVREDAAPVFEALHPDDFDEIVRSIQASAAQLTAWHLVYRVNLRDGRVLWVEGDATPERLEDGSTLWHGYIRDVTMRKQAEDERMRLQAQLNQAQKMESVGRLAGGVAHDFNNMLGVILGHAEMALAELQPTQPLHVDLKAIQHAAERSAAMTRQLLAFARKQVAAPKLLDPNEAVEGMLSMLRRLIGENVRLVWLPGRDLGRIRIDPSQLDQILANLCVNARDAIADVGTITIETRPASFPQVQNRWKADTSPGDYVELSITDTGCGMDVDVVDRLFEPFFTTKEPGQGTGLGLATVFGIVDQNGGFIDVESEPGRGSTFRVFLPRLAAAVPREHPDALAAGRASQRGGETILLVEDEPGILKLTRLMLERLGYRVHPAGSPDEALRLAESNHRHIDLLVTDVIMPEMNGRDLYARLRTKIPRLKCLYISGYTADMIGRHGVLEPGVHFTRKPYSLEELSRGVRNALAAPPPPG